MAQLLKASMKAKLVERLFFLFSLGMAQHEIRQSTALVRIGDEHGNGIMALRVSDEGGLLLLFELEVFQATFLPMPKMWGYKCSIEKTGLAGVDRSTVLKQMWEIAERAVMHYAADMGMTVEAEKEMGE